MWQPLSTAILLPSPDSDPSISDADTVTQLLQQWISEFI